MTSCWSTDPLARPGFDLIIKCLQVCTCLTTCAWAGMCHVLVRPEC